MTRKKGSEYAGEPLGPAIKMRPLLYLHAALVLEASASGRSLNSVAIEWLEATYDRRYGAEEEAEYLARTGQAISDKPTEHP